MSDKEKILNLLLSHGANERALAYAAEIAKQAFANNHLYEDLGYATRQEYNAVMLELYPSLAVLKPNETRWKKFLFDNINSIAPACEHCVDIEICHSCNKAI